MAKSKKAKAIADLTPSPFPGKKGRARSPLGEGLGEGSVDALYDLPDGWTSLPLADVCKIERGITFPATAKSDAPGHGTIACLRTTNVQATVDWDDLIYVSNSYVKNESKLLRANDILISMANSLELVGKVAFVDQLPLKSTFGGFISTIRAFDNVDPRFLFHFFRTGSAQSKMRDTASRSVNIANLSLGQIYQIPIPLPALPQQHRIVARIESLFAESRTARDALRRVPALLKRFRQSVLASAFRGELTQDAKVAHDELPEGWCFSSVGQVASVVGGIQKTPARAPKKNSFPYLRVANVLRGRLDLAEISRFELIASELQKWRLESGDVLIVEGNGSLNEIGRCAVWHGEIKNCVHQNHIIRVRFLDQVDPIYFHYYLNSSEGQNNIAAVASSTSGLYTLSVSKVQKIQFPLAPLAEQRRIVAIIESLFAQADAIERAVAIAQQRADKLDQAILARAFRGEL